MAVEIKELIIRAEMDYRTEKEDSQEETSPASPGEPNQEAIINACVKQVMKILKQKQQR